MTNNSPSPKPTPDGKTSTTDQNSASLNFSVPNLKFDKEKKEETLKKEISREEMPDTAIFHLSDPKFGFGVQAVKSTTCSLNIERKGTSLKVIGLCTGISVHRSDNFEGGIDEKGRLTMNVSCDLTQL